MLAATKVKISGSEKKKSEQEHLKRVTRKLMEFLLVVVQNNGKEMYKKSVPHVQSCFSITRVSILYE